MSGHYDGSACRACGKCPVASKKLKHYRGVDPCLGVLPDVVQACCGHAGEGDPYVVVAPGNAPGTMIPALVGPYRSYHGRAALQYFDEQGVGPPCTHEVALDNPFTEAREKRQWPEVDLQAYIETLDPVEVALG